MRAMTKQCIISLGSNLGDRHEIMASAARMIAGSCVVDGGFDTSRMFETPPIGGPGGQEPFLNAVAVFETSCSARQILDTLQASEQELGRQRKKRWDARSIDLDVVLHGNLVGGAKDLIVPHPRYTARQFVLQPACDVAAHFRDPRFGWTLGQLADHVSAGAPSLALVGGQRETRQKICRRLETEHGIKVFGGHEASPAMRVVGQAPASSPPQETEGSTARQPRSEAGEPIVADAGQPWVAGYLPPLPNLDAPQTSLPTIPRLIALLQQTSAETRWPAPHQIWPSGWQWPEYRLEIDDLNWAVSEVASALESMRCPCQPITNDGNWW